MTTFCQWNVPMARLRCAALVLLSLLFAAVGAAQTNGTVTISKNGAKELTDEETVVLTVTKGNNEVDKDEGKAKFPKNTTLNSVAAYFGPILTQNGFVEGTDFRISENSIHFYGVKKVDGGHSTGVSLEHTFNKKDFEIKKLKLSMERGSSPKFGVITIMAAGVDVVAAEETGDDVATMVRCSRVTTYYEKGDSAATVMVRIAEALTADGWDASADGDVLTVESHRGGAPLQSFSVRYEHLPDPTGGEAPDAADCDEDHWVLEGLIE